jgi:glycerate 2-kinase
VKVVIAPDAYKGGPSAEKVAAAIAEGWRSARPGDEVIESPLADGGEGTLDAMEAAVREATRHGVPGVRGPDGRLVDAGYLRLPDGSAVVELASSSGLPLMDRPDPLGASTYGLGQVMAAALDAGAPRLLVGLGGSASTDGGTGMLAALGARFLDARGEPLPPGGGALIGLDRIDRSELRQVPAEGVDVLSDVDNPLLGDNGAAAVFGPQKGATDDDIACLDAGLRRLAELLGGDPDEPGAGAAGGTAYGLAAAWGARLRSGSRAIADETHLVERLVGADLVITGEGRLDRTSLSGKVVSAVLTLAAEAGVPVAVVAGAVAPDVAVLLDEEVAVRSLSTVAGSPERSMAEPHRYLEEAARDLAAAVDSVGHARP